MDYDFTSDELAETNSESDKEQGDTDERPGMELYDWLQCVISAVLCGIFIFIFVGRPIGVEGASMTNTLYNTDRVIMSNLFYTPKNGDIIVFRTPAYDQPLVKRVIAVAGQTVDINFETGEVTLYDMGDTVGVVLDEPYIRALTHARESFEGPVTVPDGYLFVMGDNRNDSTDSRDSRVGFVDTRYVLGKVLMIVVPGKNEFGLREWGRIGSVYG